MAATDQAPDTLCSTTPPAEISRAMGNHVSKNCCGESGDYLSLADAGETVVLTGFSGWRF
jgi:hypothetical protein